MGIDKKKTKDRKQVSASACANRAGNGIYLLFEYSIRLVRRSVTIFLKVWKYDFHAPIGLSVCRSVGCLVGRTDGLSMTVSQS